MRKHTVLFARSYTLPPKLISIHFIYSRLENIIVLKQTRLHILYQTYMKQHPEPNMHITVSPVSVKVLYSHWTTKPPSPYNTVLHCTCMYCTNARLILRSGTTAKMCHGVVTSVFYFNCKNRVPGADSFSRLFPGFLQVKTLFLDYFEAFQYTTRGEENHEAERRSGCEMVGLRVEVRASWYCSSGVTAHCLPTAARSLVVCHTSLTPTVTA